MVKYFLILILISCKKEKEVLLPKTVEVVGVVERPVMTDTVNGTIDYGGKVLDLTNRMLHGKATLNNVIIKGSAWQQIFDTSINMGTNVKIYDNGAFSIRWYGAKPENQDNWWNIQKSINVSNNNFPLDFTTGDFKYSKPLKSFTIYKENYVSNYIDWKGGGDMTEAKTSLIYTGITSYGVGIQYAKGGQIKGIRFKGQFQSPVNNGIPYYSLKDDQYNDINGKCPRGYSGIVIDYDGSKNSGGSTGLKIEECWVDGYDIAYNISPNGKTFNADILELKRIRAENCRIGVQSNQAQEKGNVINYIMCWGNCYTLISIGNSGKYQAGSWTVNEGNIAGGCIELINAKLSGWNAFSINGLTAESLGRIGTVTSGDSYYRPVASLNDLRIRFVLKENAGEQILFTANSLNVVVRDPTWWYYGKPGDTLFFKGKATINEPKDFSGPVVWK